MKITSREPVVVHSHFLVDATGHHLVVVIDIMYQECFIQNSRNPTFSTMFGRSFWVHVLPESSTANTAASRQARSSPLLSSESL